MLQQHSSSSFSILETLGLRKPHSSINSTGFYVQGAEGFVKLKNHPSKRVDYANYSDLPFVDVISDNLELLVVNENFDIDSVRFYLCDMGFKGDVKRLSPEITRVNRRKHKVSFGKHIVSGDWLFVQDPTYFDNELGVIALSHPAQHLVKLFSDMTLPSKVVLPNLNRALASYPDNDALNSLLIVWERKDRNLRDNKCFGLCEEQWEYYVYATDRRSKEAFLKRTKQFIDGYLRKFPRGLHVGEANKRLLLVKKKLADMRQN
ncbi:MAG: hypothetical protein K6L80_03040 [Agarilytica sp.]